MEIEMEMEMQNLMILLLLKLILTLMPLKTQVMTKKDSHYYSDSSPFDLVSAEGQMQVVGQFYKIF